MEQLNSIPDLERSAAAFEKSIMTMALRRIQERQGTSTTFPYPSSSHASGQPSRGPSSMKISWFPNRNLAAPIMMHIQIAIASIWAYRQHSRPSLRSSQSLTSPTRRKTSSAPSCVFRHFLTENRREVATRASTLIDTLVAISPTDRGYIMTRVQVASIDRTDDGIDYMPVSTCGRIIATSKWLLGCFETFGFMAAVNTPETILLSQFAISQSLPSQLATPLIEIGVDM